MCPGKSWWLLKNGKKLYYGGILSVFLYLVLFVRLLPVLFRGLDFYSILALMLSVMILAIVAVIYISSDFSNLYKVIEGLPAHFVIEDISLLRMEVIIEDGRARRYTVKFCRFWGAPEFHHSKEDSESYEVWTPLRRSTRYPVGGLHYHADSEIKDTKLIWFLRRIGSWNPSSSAVLDGNLKEMADLRYKDEVKTISSLKSVKLIKKQGEPILLAGV
ncbi:MAG: hypothetical protein HXS44_06635 [Theionarchaea archaeon]|nr:hypothetical protein [Theionarchaea archaeon]